MTAKKTLTRLVVPSVLGSATTGSKREERKQKYRLCNKKGESSEAGESAQAWRERAALNRSSYMPARNKETKENIVLKEHFSFKRGFPLYYKHSAAIHIPIVA